MIKVDGSFWKWLLLPLAVLAVLALSRLRRAVRREQQRQLVSRRRKTDLDMARAVLAEEPRRVEDGESKDEKREGGGEDSGAPHFQIRASQLILDDDAGEPGVFQRQSTGVLVVRAGSLLYKDDSGREHVFPADDIARVDVPLADILCVTTLTSDAMFREEIHTYFQTNLPLTAAAHLSRIARFDLMLGGDS